MTHGKNWIPDWIRYNELCDIADRTYSDRRPRTVEACLDWIAQGRPIFARKLPVESSTDYAT